MRLKDLLKDEQRKKLESIYKSSKPKSNEQLKPIRLNEKLTTREWKEIMGVSRQIYKRVNGAVRRK